MVRRITKDTELAKRILEQEREDKNNEEIRRGFELTGQFVNVLSSEIDKYACRTYQHIYGDNP